VDDKALTDMGNEWGNLTFPYVNYRSYTISDITIEPCRIIYQGPDVIQRYNFDL